MDESLLFLTSTSAAVPTGRNARKKARTDLIRQSGAQGPVHGTYSTIPLMPNSRNGTLMRHQENDGHRSPKQPHRGRHSGKPDTSLEQASTGHHQLVRATSLQIVCVQQLLTEATTKIRALISKVCKAKPLLYREGLHCRPWARADFALGMLQSAPELSSAVTYLEHRISGTNGRKSLDVVGLRMYSSALMQLREALRDPERRMRSSTLAASHILALCAMFDFGQNSEWTKLVEGVVVVIKLQSERCDEGSRRHFWQHAGPVMIQSLLTRQQQAVLDQPWNRVFEAAAQESLIPIEDAQNFADSTKLVLTGSPPDLVNSRLAPSRVGVHLALHKAYDIRSRIRATLVRDLSSLVSWEYMCIPRELYDERLAAIFGLDDLISRLGPSAQNLRSLKTDSQMLYQQVIATDVMIGPIQEDQSEEHA